LVGVLIDLVSTLVYLYRESCGLAEMWPFIVLVVIGVLAGTLVGERMLLILSSERFRVVASVAVGLLGLWFLFGPHLVR
jgi:uncharacterized membrane protein YfcA